MEGACFGDPFDENINIQIFSAHLYSTSGSQFSIMGQKLLPLPQLLSYTTKNELNSYLLITLTTSENKEIRGLI